MKSRHFVTHRARSLFARTAVSLAVLFIPASASAGRPVLAQLNAAQLRSPAESLSTITDDMGRTIHVALPARRIVSLSPSMTEIVYALGSQDQLVGDTDYCDYPPDAAKKHKVGSVLSPSLEAIASLKPDLVLVTSSNRWETVSALERLGIPSYATEPHTLDEIRLLVRHLSVVVGRPEAGDALDAGLQRRMEDVRQRLRNAKPARVLFVVWTDPLVSVGKNTFLADALVHAGAASVVESEQDWPKISLEEAARLQPDLLIFASDHPESVGRDMEKLSLRADWNSLDAVKQRRYVVVSEAINRPAPRLFSAVEDLARRLHPELFPEKPVTSPASKVPAPQERN